MSVAPLLQIRRISKAYAAPVLRDIDLAVGAGEVVALTGENGAGKSTLSKIISGLATADAGEMALGGARYAPTSRQQAERDGVRIVLQELNLIETLSVAENVALGEFPARGGFIRFAEMNAQACKHLQRMGLTDVDPMQPVSDLGMGQQQLIEIARGLKGEVRLLILDEPTAMLTGPEVGRLFDQIARLRARGVGVIYISHRLDELPRVADRIVVLRDGRLVADRPARQFAHDDIVQAMVGHAPVATADRRRRSAAAEKLRIQGFSRGERVRNVSLALHAGEILGLGGLVGSGRTELLRLIFGADRRDAGTLFLDGAAVPTQIDSTQQAVALGIGLLTEDRKSQGLLRGRPISENVTLADLSRVSRRGWIIDAAEDNVVARWTGALRIRARDSAQDVDELSGGNQQKVLLARWLHRDCHVLLLDEPTRGVDAGARADIYVELEALAAAGKALLVVSSDLIELMSLCDRIAVMSAGALVQTFVRGEWSESLLLAAAFAGHEGRAPAPQVG